MCLPKGYFLKPFTIEQVTAGKKTSRRPCEVESMLMICDESSLRDRQKTMQTTRFEQQEHLLVITAEEMLVPDQPRKHYSGSSLGNCIGPIKLPELSGPGTSTSICIKLSRSLRCKALKSMMMHHLALVLRLSHAPQKVDGNNTTSRGTFHVTFGDKKKAYGNAIRRVGGTGGVVEKISDNPEKAELQKKEPRTESTQEPFCYHGYPKEVVQELLHSFSIKKCLVDLCPGDGTAGIACLEQDDSRVVYIGVCFTEHHATIVKKRLVNHILGLMATEKSQYYDARYAQHTKNERPSQDPRANGEAKPKPKRKPKGTQGGGKPKGKSKPSKPKSAKSSSSSASSSDSHS